MNTTLIATAPHPKLRQGESLERSAGIPMAPGAGTPSTATATRTRRHSLPRVRAALSGHRRTGGQPGPGGRASAGSGVSPIASGASRGVAILSGR